MNAAELRAIAKVATPGPWATDGYAYVVKYRTAEQGRTLDIAATDTGIRDEGREIANATHIATFDPSTVLQLLDAVEIALAIVRKRAHEPDYRASSMWCRQCGMLWPCEGSKQQAALAPFREQPSICDFVGETPDGLVEGCVRELNHEGHHARTLPFGEQR